MLPPPLPHQIDCLQGVLDRVSMTAVDGGPPPIVVFDVDGAVFDSRPRTHAILLDFAEDIRSDDAELADALSELPLERVHYLLTETLRECGIGRLDQVRDITSFWREMFHSDHYLHHDVPNPGAADYVQAVHRAGGGIVYLSGRDVAGMLLGTVESLVTHGFPIADFAVNLVLKPDATMGTEGFKRSVLPRFSRRGEVVAIFDDQPTSCEVAAGIYPNATVALVDLWMSEQMLPSNIAHIRDLRRR